MFYSFNSTSLDRLQNKLGELLTLHNKNIFAPNWIVVQNKEMGEWLSINIARQQGISAHNQYVFPLELAWKIYRLNDNKVAHNLPLDLIPMQWSIFELLQKKSDLLDENIIKGESLNKNQLFQISQNLADIFDLYQVYRPELLRRFEASERLTKEEEWQGEIWNSLVKSTSAEGIKSKFEANDNLLKLLKNGSYPIGKLPKAIYVFSVTQITQPLGMLLAELSKSINVFLFFNKHEPKQGAQPVKEWEEFSNHLTYPEIDYESVINSLKKQSGIEIIETDLDAEIKKTANTTLLGNIKRAISGNSYGNMNADATFHIHSCHSVKREVEELKDAILLAMERDKSLKSDDIMILVPEMADYKTILEETFKNNSEDPDLPISTGFASQNPANVAFELVINELNGSFKVTDLLAIIENPAVSHTLDLEDNDISTIRDWFIDLQIKRGKDVDVYSWLHGLTNLMLGFGMELDGFSDYDGFIPFNKITSAGQVGLAAKIKAFVHTLIFYSEAVKVNRSPVEWLEFLSEMTRTLLLPENTDKFGFKRIVRKLETLKEKLELSNYSDQVSYAFIIGWINRQINEHKATSGRFGGGITVSTYVPNRGIPYKFIAILGFNEGVFPRSERRPEYDLIHKKPQPGDRVLKEDDSYLFYQTVQSAQDFLHISYLGQDLYSKNLKLPSILLQQLIDLLKREKLPENSFFTAHKMHAFNKVYFKDGEQSYSKLNAQLSDFIYNKKLGSKEFVDVALSLEDKNQIKLDDLIAYYKDPSRFIARNLLGISLYDDYQELENREPFDLDNLENYQIRNRIKNGVLGKVDLENLTNNLQLSGLLPQKAVGKFVWDMQEKKMSGFKQQIQNYPAHKNSAVEIDLTIGDYQITGTISDVFDDEYVFISAAGIKAKYFIEVWIGHLILSLVKPDLKRSALICYNSKKSYESYFFTPVNKEDAEEQLEQLLEQYINGSQNPKKYAYEPQMAFEFCDKLSKKPDDSVLALKDAAEKWEGSPWSQFTPPKDEPYNRLIWQSNPADEESFQEVSKIVFKKLILAKRTGK